MPTYITMIKWTQQGIKAVKESPARLDAAKKFFAKDGVTMKEVFLAMGQHDMITILDAPDDAAVARTMLKAGSLGNFTSETCRVFTEDEYRQIMKGLD